MDASWDWKEALWRQFGAAIEMLENAVVTCPEALWGDRSRRPEFWHVAYHTLFWLDLYLWGSPEGFAPPAPFTLNELDPEAKSSEPLYTKEQLLPYLEHCRAECRAKLEELTEEEAARRCGFTWHEMSAGELFLYNLRHVQHHAGQLNVLLRQEVDAAPRWVKRAGSGLRSEG